MNAEQQGGQFLRSTDLFVASGLLALGSLLLLFSSLYIIGYSMQPWLTVLRFPAVGLHFFGWAALAGLLAEPEGGRPEDPVRLRKKTLIFIFILIAFAAGLFLLPLVRQPLGLLAGWEVMVVAFLFPYVPVVYAPVVFVHAGIIWWSSAQLRAEGQRLLARAAALTLATTAGIGLVAQFVYPELVWGFAHLAGLTVIGYTLAGLGWWRAFRQDLRARPITLSEHTD